MSRATPMPADARRQAIIAATLPLLLEHGPQISTREIARAAGVAEGTIFRAFGTKDDLIHATIHAALQPTQAMARLADLPQTQPLDQRAACIVEIVQAEVVRTRSLFATLVGSAPHPGPPPRHGGPPDPHQAKARLLEAVALSLEPYTGQLRVSPGSAARILATIAFANTIVTPDPGLNDPNQLADIALHGIAKGTQ